jgi:hypothetical protein
MTMAAAEIGHGGDSLVTDCVFWDGVVGFVRLNPMKGGETDRRCHHARRRVASA